MFWATLLPFGLIATVLTEELCTESVVKNLPDSSFSSSSTYTLPEDEKKYGSSRAKTTSLAGSWVAATVDQNQWLQIYLQRASVIKEITTLGRDVDVNTGCCGQWVSSYFVEYSTDNRTWLSANYSTQTMIFPGNTDTDSKVTNQLACPVIAKFVRILPQSWHGHIAMRVDVVGCHIETDAGKDIGKEEDVRGPTVTSLLSTKGVPDRFTRASGNVPGNSNEEANTMPTTKTFNYFQWSGENQGESDLSRKGQVWLTTLFGEAPPTESTSNHQRYARSSTSQYPWNARDSGVGQLIRTQYSNYPIRTRVISDTDAYVPLGRRIYGPTEYIPRGFIPKEYINNNQESTGSNNWYPSGVRNNQQVPEANQWKTSVNNQQVPVTNNQQISGGFNWQLSGGSNNQQPSGSNSWNPSVGQNNQQTNSGNTGPNRELSGGSTIQQPSSSNSWNPSDGQNNQQTSLTSGQHLPVADIWQLSGGPSGSSNQQPNNNNQQLNRGSNWNQAGPNLNNQQMNSGSNWNPSGDGRFQQGVIAPKANSRCIESCYNRPDGDYQSCRSCRVYVSCSNGNTFDNRECPGTLVWNDDQKYCDWTSTSCS